MLRGPLYFKITFMFLIKKLGWTLLVLVFLASCKNKETTEKVVVVDWAPAQQYYQTQMDEALALMDSLKAAGPVSPRSKAIFIKTRQAFKRAEPFASYLNPAVGHKVNGPPLPVFLDDNSRVMPAVGLQILEEHIFEQDPDTTAFNYELRITKGLMHTLVRYLHKKELDPQRFFVSIQQQLLRIISLGISGFDSPMGLLGLEESAISLRSLQEVYSQSIAHLVQQKDPGLHARFNSHLESAIAYLEKHPDFAAFDRYTFIREYMNPITRDWLAIRKTTGLWEGTDTFPFNFEAPTFFEKNSFNLNYFTPPTNRNPTDKQIALGKKLFFETKLSKTGSMACATCHIPEKAYTDGMVTNMDNSGSPLERNTPTLINSAFQRSFFLDGRSETLLAQINSVFDNEKEFNSKAHQFSDTLLRDSTYARLFNDAFGRVNQRNKQDIIKAISSYVSTLNGFDSKFDRNIRGDEDTMTQEEKHGFNLFMGKALCATCHFIPLTNGTVPPFYADTEKEVIGVPETAANKTLDNDWGFYWKYREELHKGMFKTPTIRNAALTAPYMHNGVYNTLEEVMDFYNKGGGGGLGFGLEFATLPFDELNLTDAEQQALVAFVKTLTDTKVEAY